MIRIRRVAMALGVVCEQVADESFEVFGVCGGWMSGLAAIIFPEFVEEAGASWSCWVGRKRWKAFSDNTLSPWCVYKIAF